MAMGDYRRLPEITSLFTFGVILVLFEHSFPPKSFNIIVPGFFSCAYKVISGFDMQLFTFISGFLFMYTNDARGHFESVPHILKKIKRLMVPYFMLGSLAFVLKAPLSGYAVRPLDFSFEAYIRGFIFPVENAIITFWFLPTLFLILVIAPLFYEGLLLPKRGIFVVVCTAFLVWIKISNPLYDIKVLNISGICELLIYFWIGCLYYFKKEQFERMNRIYLLIIALFLVIVVESYDNAFSSRIGRIITVFVWILVSLTIIQLYVGSKLRLFGYIDGYYYQIYLLSWFSMVCIRIVFFNILEGSFYRFFLMNVFAGIIFPVLATKWVQRHYSKLGIVIGL